MSNPIKCPCDCPASILDKQNYESYKRQIENRECASDNNDDQKSEHDSKNSECENNQKNNHITNDNELSYSSQDDQKHIHDHDVCVAYEQSDQNLKSNTDSNVCGLCNENYNTTKHGANCNDYISNNQSQKTPKIESDSKESLNEEQVKTDVNISQMKSVISQKKDEKIINESEDCLKVLKESISQLYALSEQNCLKEKTPVKQAKPETKEESQIGCTEKKLETQHDLSPLTLPAIKCGNQDQLKTNLSLQTTPSLGHDDQEKLKLNKKPLTPPKSSSSNFKKCIDEVCSKICQKLKGIESNLTSTKDKSNLPASSGLRSNSSTERHKNSKSSVRSKSSKPDKSPKLTTSVLKESPEPSEVVIVSRAEQKFYEFETKPSKACSSKGSSKGIKARKSDCNNNCTCSKKSWWWPGR